MRTNKAFSVSSFRDKSANPCSTKSWPGRAARRLCGEIYRGLLSASEQWLDAHATNENGPLPKPGGALARRFDGA